MASSAFSEETKCIITGLLISSVTKCTVKQLCNDFMNTVGYGIPYRELGFASQEDYLQSIPDTVRLIGSGLHAEVVAVVKPKSAHVNELVSKQKKTAPSYRRRSFAPRTFQTPRYGAHVRPTYYQPRQAQQSGHPPDRSSQSQSNHLRPQQNSTSGVYVGPDLDQSESDDEDQTTRQILYQKTQPIPKEEEEYKSKVPNEVQNNLRKLIAHHPNGIFCSKLPEEYRKAFGRGLHYEMYNYLRLIDMCSNLPQIFHYLQSSSDDFLLFDKTKPMPDIKCAPISRHTQSNIIVEDDFVTVDQKLDWADGPHLIPPDVVNLGEVIPRFFIQDEDVGDYLDINLGEVYDPSKFWVFIRTGPLTNLMLDLQQFFHVERNKYAVAEPLLDEGLYCVALYYGEYHRAVIVRLLPTVPGQVKVLFIDYGTVCAVSSKELWYLPSQFATVPCQAIRSRLANIYPPVEDTPWSVEATNKFREMINGRFLIANITKIDRVDKILEIYLADVTDKSNIFYLNDVIVSEGFAVYIDQERKRGIVDKNCRPSIQHIHLYPEFVEIEAGYAPTLLEMNCIIQDRISLDQYYPHYFNKTFREDYQAMDCKEREWSKSGSPPKYVKLGKRDQQFNFGLFPERLVNDMTAIVKDLFPGKVSPSGLPQKNPAKESKKPEEESNKTYHCQYRKIISQFIDSDSKNSSTNIDSRLNVSKISPYNSYSDTSEDFNGRKKSVVSLAVAPPSLLINNQLKREVVTSSPSFSTDSLNTHGWSSDKSSLSPVTSPSYNWDEPPFPGAESVNLNVESVQLSNNSSTNSLNIGAKKFVPVKNDERISADLIESCKFKSTNPFLTDIVAEVAKMKPNNPFLEDLKKEINSKVVSLSRPEAHNLEEINSSLAATSRCVETNLNRERAVVKTSQRVRTPPGFHNGQQPSAEPVLLPLQNFRSLPLPQNFLAVAPVQNFQSTNPYYQRFANPQMVQYNQLAGWFGNQYVDPRLIALMSQLQMGNNMYAMPRNSESQNFNRYPLPRHYGPPR